VHRDTQERMALSSECVAMLLQVFTRRAAAAPAAAETAAAATAAAETFPRSRRQLWCQHLSIPYLLGFWRVPCEFRLRMQRITDQLTDPRPSRAQHPPHDIFRMTYFVLHHLHVAFVAGEYSGGPFGATAGMGDLTGPETRGVWIDAVGSTVCAMHAVGWKQVARQAAVTAFKYASACGAGAHSAQNDCMLRERSRATCACRPVVHIRTHMCGNLEVT
jgi:hypothetical protein